jgi:hypothetical protein
MSRASVTTRGQRFAETGMVDACTIRRRTGEQTNDDVTAVVTHAYVSPDPYSGPCRVQQGRLATSSDTNVGEDTAVELALEVQLPIAVTGLQVGDEVTITTSLDADLPGRVFLIRGLGHKTHPTARRVQCTERTDR